MAYGVLGAPVAVRMYDDDHDGRAIATGHLVTVRSNFHCSLIFRRTSVTATAGSASPRSQEAEQPTGATTVVYLPPTFSGTST